MPHASDDGSAIRAYWQPGCTSCLRMKEFLAKHGVPFVSVNVLEDKDAGPARGPDGGHPTGGEAAVRADSG